MSSRNDFGEAAARFQNLMYTSAATLVGMVQGVLSDGELQDSEIAFLRAWLLGNKVASQSWPGNVLHMRIEQCLEDGVITPDERQHLMTTLQQLVGGTLEDLAQLERVCELGVDDVEDVPFAGRSFCLTGEFAFGPRKICHAAIARRGGTVADGMSRKVQYLVVGGLGSPEWSGGSFGTKIETAMKLKAQGKEVFVVHEQVWADSLSRHPVIQQ